MMLLKPQLRIFILLLLTSSCRGKSQLIGPSQPIVATLGDDVILPCHLTPAMNATGLMMEWTRPDLNPRFVFVRRSGQELVTKKHEWYEGRTSLFIDELKHGNVSLKLSKVKLSDEGRYRFFIPPMDIDIFVDLAVDDFFVVQTSPAIYISAGVAAGFVCSLVCFAVWKLRQKQTKNKRNQKDETDRGRKTMDVESHLLTEGERKTKRRLKKLEKNVEDTQRKLHEEKQRREKAENKNTRLEKEHEKLMNEHERLKNEREKPKSVLEKLEKRQTALEDLQQKTEAIKQSTSQMTSSSFVNTRETHSGSFSVDEIDLKGNFVRIRNNSILAGKSLSDWKMKIEVDKNKPIECELPRTFTILAGQTVTIWASDSGRSQDPYNDVVLRKQKPWIFRDHIKVSLLHPSGKEKAMRELKKIV